MASASIAKTLQGQGFGTLKACRLACRQGRVRLLRENGEGEWSAEDPDAPWPHGAGRIRFDGGELPYREKLLLLLHKPEGWECSRNPAHHPSVFSGLPAPFAARGVQPVGRLDADTTGALLLTDQGAWNHRLAGPRQQVPKTYLADCESEISEEVLSALRKGVTLRGEAQPTLPAEAERAGPCQVRLTLREGRYHQVKRMLAAVGNPVKKLHRESVGGIGLEGLAPGAWRELTPEERRTLSLP